MVPAAGDLRRSGTGAHRRKLFKKGSGFRGSESVVCLGFGVWGFRRKGLGLLGEEAGVGV